MNEEINKSYYAVIPANVRYDKRLKDKAKLLYAEITSLANEKGFCWASNSYFANLYGVSKETISRLLKELKKYNYIDIEIKYKKNSKEIEQRVLTLLTKKSIPIDENVIDPIDEKIKENNIKLFNNILCHFNNKNCFNKVKKMTKSRLDKLSLRVKENGEKNFLKAIDIASESDFLTGENDRNWKMDFDWLIANDTNIIKVLEGKYSNKQKKTESSIYGPILN